MSKCENCEGPDAEYECGQCGMILCHECMEQCQECGAELCDGCECPDCE